MKSGKSRGFEEKFESVDVDANLTGKVDDDEGFLFSVNSVQVLT